ncbi:MAG: sulfotransferase [Pseudomonadota bacterium]
MSVLFFCVGAAKAGTSWLHKQLSAHPECHFRAIKELHYFDALEKNKLADELIKHRDQQKAMLDQIAYTAKPVGQAKSMRLADRAAWIDVLETGGDVQAYLDYLHADAADARLVGDITPAYALLPEARLREMARLKDDVRFLYLMRDPLDRLWSHVRMIAARRDTHGRVTERRCARILRRTLNGEETQIVARSDYAGALARLSAAVLPAKLRIEVFEEMVAGDGFGRICDFLGISRAAPDPVPVHEGQTLEMSREQRLAALQWLAPQYEATHQALGRMPESWAMEGTT